MVKKVLLIVVVLLVLGGGAFFARSKGYLFKNSKSTGTSTNEESNAPQNYLNFAGDYSFIAPEGYSVDDTTIYGTQLILKQGEKLQVETVDEIYSKGAIAIQAFSPALSDADAFKNYINNTLKDAVEKSIKDGKSEIVFAKQDSYTTATIKTSVNGKLVRVQYILNTDKPVIIASGEENTTYKALVDSLGVASKNNKDFTTIQTAIMSFSSLLKNRMTDDIYRLSSTEFKGQTSLDKLKESVNQASVALDANISVSGAVLGKDKATASLLFSKPATKADEQPKNAVGAISLQKEDAQWKVSGITLPGKEAFDPPKEED